MSLEAAARRSGSPKECEHRRVPEAFPVQTLSSTSSCLRSVGNRIPLTENISIWVGISVSEWFFGAYINDTYLFIDSLAENSKQEDSCNGRSQVTGNGLDVIKELPTLR